MSEKYYRTAFCFVLELCAGNLEIHDVEKEFVDSLAKKFGINEESKKSFVDSVYYRYIPKSLV